MKAELVAEQVVTLPVGRVRLTLARHDDGHYSGIASLVGTGQRIGMLEAGPATDGIVQLDRTMVDATMAGPEIITELEHLLVEAAAAETGIDVLASLPVMDTVSDTL